MGDEDDDGARAGEDAADVEFSSTIECITRGASRVARLQVLSASSTSLHGIFLHSMSMTLSCTARERKRGERNVRGEGRRARGRGR
jgi:hypothetical protein